MNARDIFVGRRTRAGLLIVAVGATLAATGMAGREGSDPAPAPARAVTRPASADAACTLRQDMRKLWSDHVIWTRDYIIAAAADAPDQSAASDRLMKNQGDIGSAVGAFYGTDAGAKLTDLLREHISIAADLIKAAKAGDQAKVTEVSKKWQENGDQIATFLSGANPNWPKQTLTDMMRMHLSTTTDEVTARLKKDWAKDVAAFDAAYEHILKMSDALTDGIVKQFPARFPGDSGAGR